MGSIEDPAAFSGGPGLTKLSSLCINLLLFEFESLAMYISQPLGGGGGGGGGGMLII